MEFSLLNGALLFDLDDTLVRTEDVVVKSMSAWCRLHDLDLQLVLSHSSGMRIEDTVAKVAPHLDAEHERKRIEAIERECLDNLEPVFGAVELLRKLHPDHWGIVTSSSSAIAQTKMTIVGIDRPKTLITSESVTNGKPHPESYLLGAAAIGFKLGQCIVFEDSGVGIEAGLSAGCSVVGVGERVPSNKPVIATVPDLSCVDVVGNSLVIQN